jgi:hypothetical protein
VRFPVGEKREGERMQEEESTLTIGTPYMHAKFINSMSVTLDYVILYPRMKK